MNPIISEAKSRVLAQILGLSAKTNLVEVAEVAHAAKTTETVVRRILAPFLTVVNDQISVPSRSRVMLAMELARAGRLKKGAEALSWQEFVKFSRECLEEAGFRTRSNVRVRGQGRAWQIDVVGFRGDLVLTIDCKHWNTSGYLSRFKTPAKHAREATSHLVNNLGNDKEFKDKEPSALPLILCLLEPPDRFLQGTLLTSVEKFPEFLASVAPYDLHLPFIHRSPVAVENPIS